VQTFKSIQEDISQFVVVSFNRRMGRGQITTRKNTDLAQVTV